MIIRKGVEIEFMGAKLEYCANIIEIVNFCHSVEEESSGNPYNCSFDIRIVSGMFSGVADGCEYDYKEWRKFVEQLNNLILFKTDKVVLHEIGYGGTINFVGDGLGHIEVSGLVYGNAMSHSLQFEFMTDQTAFPSFLTELQSL